MTVRTFQRQHTYRVEVEMIVWECPNCGIVHGIPRSFADECRKDGTRYYCPNGHSLGWHDTDLDRERKRGDRMQSRAVAAERSSERNRQLAEFERRSAAAHKGHMTRLRNRIANGVCPCCSRSFTNVARHIASQHPDYALPGGDD